MSAPLRDDAEEKERELEANTALHECKHASESKTLDCYCIDLVVSTNKPIPTSFDLSQPTRWAANALMFLTNQGSE